MSNNPARDEESLVADQSTQKSDNRSVETAPHRAKMRMAIGSQRDVADPKLAARRAPTADDVRTADHTDQVADIQQSPPETESPTDEPKPNMAPSSMPTEIPDLAKSDAVAPATSNPTAAEPLDRIEPLPPVDIESEIAAALSGFSMDQIVERTTAPIAAVELELGSRIKAFVGRVEGDHVFVQLPGRHEGIASLRQFHRAPVPGALVEVIVKSHNEDEGLYELAVPGAAVDAGDWASLNVGDIVDARVTGSNTGGLEVSINQLRGFIPASQIDRVRVEHFGDYVNQKLTCLVTEINPQKKRLILSRRALLDREHEELRRRRLAEIQVGETYEGLVTRLVDFGAFVDLDGVEGLVHISKLSWGHIKHPKEIVREGQRIRVKVETANPETGKFSLSYRDTMEHPWQRAAERFPVGSTVTGTVTRIAQFGAFVKLDSGIEGLIHISELSHGRVANVGQVVKENQQVEVKIVSLDESSQRIALSLKATQPEPVPEAEKETATADEPPRSYAVPKPSQPLRGGKGRDSGGQRFGLNL